MHLLQWKKLTVLTAAWLVASVVWAGPHLADQHVKAGVTCQTCHGKDLKNVQVPETGLCVGCHNVDELVKRTQNLKPTNPHMSPHYGKTLDCTNCHYMHSDSEDYCAQCHQFNFKVP